MKDHERKNEVERKRVEASERRAKETEEARQQVVLKMKEAMDQKKAEMIQLRYRGLSDREFRNRKSNEEIERRRRENDIVAEAANMADAERKKAGKPRFELLRKKQTEQVQVIKKSSESNEKPVHGIDAIIVVGGVAGGWAIGKGAEVGKRIKDNGKEAYERAKDWAKKKMQKEGETNE